MTVTVRAARSDCPAIRFDLARRRAIFVESEAELGEGAIRADVPLAELLGYQSWIEQLTEGRAEVHMGLSHYAPLRSDPGPHAA